VLWVDHQQPFADGVQHRIVVFVHAGQLGRTQAQGLSPQPPTEQQRSCRSQHQGQRDHPEQQRQLGEELPPDGGLGDPHRDQADHGAVGLLHRGHRTDGGSQGAPIDLGEHLPGQRGGDGAQERLT